MNPDDYARLHEGEEEKLNKHIHKFFDKFAEAQPKVAKGMEEMFLKGVLENPEVQEKMREMWNSKTWNGTE